MEHAQNLDCEIPGNGAELKEMILNLGERCYAADPFLKISHRLIGRRGEIDLHRYPYAFYIKKGTNTVSAIELLVGKEKINPDIMVRISEGNRTKGSENWTHKRTRRGKASQRNNNRTKVANKAVGKKAKTFEQKEQHKHVMSQERWSCIPLPQMSW